MPNNKIVDREALKATRQAFQNALENGQIVPSKAISTKQIEAISSDSGTIQEAPFIAQGTGTANGTTIVDTSPVGKHLEKQGNAIVYNQQIDPTNFRNGDANAWSYDSNTKLFRVAYDNTSGTSTAFGIATFDNCPFVYNHKYYVRIKQVSGTPLTTIYIVQSNQRDLLLNPIIVGDRYETSIQFSVYIYAGTSIDSYFTLEMVDLTKWFNGDIPQDILDTPAHFSRYYNGDLTHNLGEIRFGAGRYLECGQSRNVWDEEWEAGTFDTITGENTSGIGIRSKNLIRVIPNMDYYGWCGSSGGFWVMFLDKDENVIPLTNDIGTVVNNVVSIRENIIKTPANAAYAKFYISSEYGTTYKHDITISLYYSTGEGYYGHYYPYVAPKIYATGTEVLRKAGTAKDIKYPNGTIIRNVGSRAYESGDETDSSVLTDGTTTYYQLAIPTTEQGTPFSENIEINDYSYMSWLDTNNLLVDVPQGCKIFYPADYVLFTDSLGQKFEWDVNNIASKDEVEEVACDDYVEVINYTLDEDITSFSLTVDLQGNYRKLLIQVVKVAEQSNATANVTCILSNNQGEGFRYALSAPDRNRYTAALIRLDGRKLYCESKLGSYTYEYPSDTRLMFKDVGTKGLTITKFNLIFELAEWKFKAGTQIIVWGVK